jgi:hypothetical protein
VFKVNDFIGRLVRFALRIVPQDFFILGKISANFQLHSTKVRATYIKDAGYNNDPDSWPPHCELGSRQKRIHICQDVSSRMNAGNYRNGFSELARDTDYLDQLDIGPAGQSPACSGGGRKLSFGRGVPAPKFFKFFF